MVRLFASAALPTALNRRLNEVLAQGIESSTLKTRFTIQGAELSSSSAPELAAYVKTELVRWTKVPKDIGITNQP